MPKPTELRPRRPRVDPDTRYILEEALEVLSIIRDHWDPEAGVDPADRLHLLQSITLQVDRSLPQAIETALAAGYTWKEIRGFLAP